MYNFFINSIDKKTWHEYNESMQRKLGTEVFYEKGRLQEGKRLENRGISGIPFTVTIERTEGGQVIPIIHSRACLIGKGCLLLEEDDPLQDGFSVKCGEEVKI